MNTLREARLRRDLHNVASQVDTLLSRLGDESADRMHELRDRMSHAASGLGSRLSALDVSMRDSARQAAKVTDAYVHDHPWKVIGAGAAIGLLLGYLASRR